MQVGLLGEGQPSSEVGVNLDRLSEQLGPSALGLYPPLTGLVWAANAGGALQWPVVAGLPRTPQRSSPLGITLPAIRRAARLGDGWLPIGLSTKDLAAQRQVLRRVYEENGRGPDSVRVALSLPLHLGEPLITSDGERQPLTGEPSEIVDDIRRYRDVAWNT